MKRALLLVALFAVALGSSTFARSHKIDDGFAPENNLWIGVDDKMVSTVTKEAFNKIMDDVGAIYAPIVKARGGTLQFQRNWDDGTVNAYASRSGTTWVVAMFGGLARYKDMTVDGFTYVVCHELGHHLGGAPKYARNPWASVEGQSDYYGGLKCMKRLWANDDNVAIVEAMKVDATVNAKCDKAFNNSNEAALCKRLSMAGLTLGQTLADLGREKAVSFTTPSTVVVTKLMESHPPAQCRLDTYFAAALCDKDPTEDFSDTDRLVGACNAGTDKVGIRPACWYK